MVECAEYAEVDQLPELHLELLNFTKNVLGPKALEILRRLPLVYKRRLERLERLKMQLSH